MTLPAHVGTRLRQGGGCSRSATGPGEAQIWRSANVWGNRASLCVGSLPLLKTWQVGAQKLLESATPIRPANESDHGLCVKKRLGGV